MKRAHAGIQALAVLSLIGLVSWPQFRPARAAATMWWRTGGPLAPERNLSKDHRVTDGQSSDRIARIGYGSHGSSQAADWNNGDPSRNAGRSNSILGEARTTSNAPVPYARVVLRNALTGRLEARATADANGSFSFLDVLPARYFIELISADGKVISSSAAVLVTTNDNRITILVASGSTVAAVFGTVMVPTVSDSLKTASDEHVSTQGQPDATLSPRR